MGRIIITIALMTFGIQYCAAQEENWTTIKNGIEWTDTDGYIVQAHGGNFLHVGNKWYLIGEDRARSWNPDVNLYSTEDFVNWKFEGKVIKNRVTHEELGVSRMIERPKILYNEKTKKFVIWCHWESRNYGASEAAVFVSDLVWSGLPVHTGT